MARPKKNVYGADFETVVSEERTRVWLWGLMNFDSMEFYYGNDIDSFILKLCRIDSTVYFHNVKFDVQFLFYWMFKNGFKHVTSKYLERKQFKTLISDMGLFYSIDICFENGVKVKILDSYKLIPLSIEAMPKAFGLDIKKLDLDYGANRDINHKPTENEIQYVKNDVEILVRSVKAMKNQGMSKMTAASNALNHYKQIITTKEFGYKFPSLTLGEDKDLRMSYKGGWTYLNPKYKDKLLGIGRVYDVNSMYPWAMRNCKLPYGPPVFYNGKYVPDELMTLYIQSISCRFKLKDGKYPSIQLKGNMRFGDTEYIIEAMEEPEILTLTSVDLELLFENYDVYDINYNCGYKFRACRGLFDNYIDYWYGVKNDSKKNGNKAMYYISKLMLNSLYGKFGSNPRKRAKYPYYSEEEDIVKYELGIEEISNGGYVPVASFITSYARDKIIRAANACGDRFVYADTDSIHIIGDEEPDIDIDEYELGAFKLENTFDMAKFHRAKCYIESFNGTLEKKCAGLPKRAKELFGFDTMEVGYSFDGKLVPKNVPGGTVLVERKFTIK